MAQYSRRVNVQDLKPGMILEEILELSIDYASLDPDSLNFVQTIFRGTSAVVVDDSGTRHVRIDQLQPFDQIQSIVDISSDLIIAQVIPGTAKYLEQRGILACKVSEHSAGARSAGGRAEDIEEPHVVMHQLPTLEAVAVASEEARKLHEIKKVQIKHFLDTLEIALQNRDQSSGVVEEMLDQGRRGVYSSKGVESMVDEIMQEGSAPAMKALAGLKGSDQTYTHCTDTSVILQECYTDIIRRTGRAPNVASERSTLIAGFMHDIGKSEVPKEILDSASRYTPDSREMTLLRNHATYGARILEEMGMGNSTINVAHYHHVKKDGTLLTSYPDAKYDQVLPLTRLASVVDVYQALIGNRRYKRNWVPAKAMEYLLRLRGSEFDERMLDQFLDSMGRFPIGSLVRLSTGDLAFVFMIAPRDHLDRPIVAVVENAAGELLTHHSLLDLMLEPDIVAEEAIDHYAHYSKTDDQAYDIFTSIRID